MRARAPGCNRRSRLELSMSTGHGAYSSPGLSPGSSWKRLRALCSCSLADPCPGAKTGATGFQELDGTVDGDPVGHKADASGERRVANPVRMTKPGASRERVAAQPTP